MRYSLGFSDGTTKRSSSSIKVQDSVCVTGILCPSRLHLAKRGDSRSPSDVRCRYVLLPVPRGLELTEIVLEKLAEYCLAALPPQLLPVGSNIPRRGEGRAVGPACFQLGGCLSLPLLPLALRLRPIVLCHVASTGCAFRPWTDRRAHRRHDKVDTGTTVHAR